MLLAAFFLDPRANTPSKWMYWLAAPAVSIIFLTVYFTDWNAPIKLSDLTGDALVALVFTYIGYGVIYLRKTRLF